MKYMKSLLSLLENVYKGKTVLVTGHTGFKGSWLSIWLNKLGANVIGYSLDPVNQEDNFVLSGISEKIIDIRGDIRDKKKLISIFRERKPEIVFHLAAQPLVMNSYTDPGYTYEVNIMGTVNVLEGFRESQNSKIAVIITSDKCYENKEWVWGYRENDQLGGYDPYSSSKGCVELIVSSYRRSFFNPQKYLEHKKAISSVRAGNVVGGGDWSANRIMPDCIRALQANREIIVRNKGAIRPWQHVLEPMSGYLLLGAKMAEDGVKYGDAWNFGPNQGNVINVEKVVENVIKQWGYGSYKNLESSSNKVHEAGLLNLEISKAQNFLGWYPRWNIDETIKKTVEWYKSYKTQNVYDICISQIIEYCTKT